MALPFSDPATPVPRERALFCNRTLNMRAIRAVGYDMDYTLVHYDIEAWERRAYEHVRERLLGEGLPVGDLTFDPKGIIRGLIIDRTLGNVVKANRFGYVKRALHGTRPLGFEELRAAYSGVAVDLSEPRWVFLNTLFSLSEACMFAQLVDLCDQGVIGMRGYQDVYELVRTHIDRTHMEGELKREIMERPEHFVKLDPDAALALLDQKSAGKKLMLITNSEWRFTDAMMSYTFDRFLPATMKWRDVFDLVIVAANKPRFFEGVTGFLEIASEDGLLRPVVGPLQLNKAYYGGHAGEVESFLGLSGDEILYVGDHIFGDVNVSKRSFSWRTALVVRELEEEIVASGVAQPELDQLAALMAEKETLEREQCALRLTLIRLRAGEGEGADPRLRRYGPVGEASSASECSKRISEIRTLVSALDARISPLARAAGEVANPSWGPLMWAGNDKSHFARQVERHADIYTSRVSNFAFASPFVYLRSPRGTLPHDVAPAPAAGAGAYATTGPPSSRSKRP